MIYYSDVYVIKEFHLIWAISSGDHAHSITDIETSEIRTVFMFNELIKVAEFLE